MLAPSPAAFCRLLFRVAVASSAQFVMPLIDFVSLNMHPNRRRSPLALIYVSTALFVLLYAWYYYPFVADDAFISFRYAERLLDGKGLTWTEGGFRFGIRDGSLISGQTSRVIHSFENIVCGSVSAGPEQTPFGCHPGFC